MTDFIKTEGANEYEIEDYMRQIQGLHSSFDENNPVTYQVLLIEFGEKLNKEQKYLIEMMKNKALDKLNYYNDLIRKHIDNDISRQPILTKVKEEENKRIVIKEPEPETEENIIYNNEPI